MAAALCFIYIFKYAKHCLQLFRFSALNVVHSSPMFFHAFGFLLNQCIAHVITCYEYLIDMTLKTGQDMNQWS